MISRRNIRVKVMQTLYTINTMEEAPKPGAAQAVLAKHFEGTKNLFTYLLFAVHEVAAYAEKDAYKRSSKHLPSEADLTVNTKIAGNEWLWRLKEDAVLQQHWKATKPDQTMDKDLVRKLYMQLVATPEYKAYTAQQERDRQAERTTLQFLGDFVLGDEAFIQHVEDLFPNWADDAELTLGLAKAYLSRPGQAELTQFISPDKLQFAQSLLATVLEKGKHLEEYIFPKLKNWDSERIASVDMILMKMGVAEFLYFETIPPKVTINEYIELAKEYSTGQSGQFVNGILDNIHKELGASGRLHKTEYRKF